MCGVTQPTLSAGIRHLEETLGVLLVLRGSRYQGLTQEGEAVVLWARRIVADERSMRDEVLTFRSGIAGHLRLAVIPTAITVLAKLTMPFSARHPAVTFSILSRTSDEILAGLDSLNVDAGLTYLDEEPIGRARRLPLYTERYRALTPLDGPFADRDSMQWKDFAGIPVCLLTNDMQNRRIIERKLASAGTAATVALQSDSLLTLLAHARTGAWTAIVPQTTAADFASPQTHSVAIADPEGGPSVGIIYTARDPLTPALEAFLASAKRGDS